MIDALGKNSLDGQVKISSYRAQWFLRGKGHHRVARDPEKPPEAVERAFYDAIMIDFRANSSSS